MIANDVFVGKYVHSNKIKSFVAEVEALKELLEAEDVEEDNT